MDPVVTEPAKRNDIFESESSSRVPRPRFDMMGVESVFTDVSCLAASALIVITFIDRLDQFLPK